MRRLRGSLRVSEQRDPDLGLGSGAQQHRPVVEGGRVVGRVEGGADLGGWRPEAFPVTREQRLLAADLDPLVARGVLDLLLPLLVEQLRVLGVLPVGLVVGAIPLHRKSWGLALACGGLYPLRYARTGSARALSSTRRAPR